MDRILTGIPRLTIAVVGDLFLDRYLDIDPALTEVSVETGLDAYQVVRVRSSPGAAGTVMNNLVALGVRRVMPVAVIGDDGEGYELRAALQQRGMELDSLISCASRRTPTYTKPLLQGAPPRELHRLDIKNRTPLPQDVEAGVIRCIDTAVTQADAVIVVDQVAEADCGVVTTHVREKLARLGNDKPNKVILVDSRSRIGLFRNLWLKPNEAECTASGASSVQELAKRAGRPVFCTRSERGILAVDPRSNETWEVPAYPVSGPTDPVGAGDSTSAAIACAIAAGASIPEAAAFGNLVASITIQQIGTTGTASAEQVRERWQEVCANA